MGYVPQRLLDRNFPKLLELNVNRPVRLTAECKPRTELCHYHRENASSPTLRRVYFCESMDVRNWMFFSTINSLHDIFVTAFITCWAWFRRWSLRTNCLCRLVIVLTDTFPVWFRIDENQIFDCQRQFTTHLPFWSLSMTPLERCRPVLCNLFFCFNTPARWATLSMVDD